jgi:hypothetical protein
MSGSLLTIAVLTSVAGGESVYEDVLTEESNGFLPDLPAESQATISAADPLGHVAIGFSELGEHVVTIVWRAPAGAMLFRIWTGALHRPTLDPS